MGRVAELGCIVCRHIIGWPPGEKAEVHHCFDTEDRNDFLTIPLCPEHHRGATGFHGLGERAFNRKYKTSETKLLALTYRQLEERRPFGL